MKKSSRHPIFLDERDANDTIRFLEKQKALVKDLPVSKKRKRHILQKIHTSECMAKDFLGLSFSPFKCT